MRRLWDIRSARILVLVALATIHPLCGQAPIPPEVVGELESAFKTHTKASSPARQRLALKRLIRDAGEALESQPEAPNRFEVLKLLFQAMQTLLSMDESSRNREALLETARELTAAPDSFASVRLEAELLLTQTELARKGASAKDRMDALRPMMTRYRDTPAEAKMIRVALLLALEVGDSTLIRELRETITERFAGDLEMISFQRDKLGGQVFGAPFCGTFKRSDGTTACYPCDGLGQSTGLYFWSARDGGMEELKRFAAAWKEQESELAGRLNVVSFNLDGLPDAGEKVLRELGLSWPALHLPEGVRSPYYKAFARRTPSLVTLSPTGQAALLMAGATRRSSGTTPTQRDYSRWINSTIARSWTKPRYVNQLASIFAGDFLLIDPKDPFDPTFPPELKASFLDRNVPALQSAQSGTPVPDETLRGIQACFTPPPFRFRLTAEEIRDRYLKVDELGSKAEASHPDAPNLWIVYNRRIIARMGLWKITADFDHFKKAVALSQKALSLSAPEGADLIARFCLARQALHASQADPVQIIADLLSSLPPDASEGPALAVAGLLGLDAGRRDLHEQYRSRILARHLDSPAMWNFSNFLLNRYHRYQLYRAPFTAGWSIGRRQDYYLAHGQTDSPTRKPGPFPLTTLDGSPVSLPDDPRGKWTALLVHGQPVEDKRAPIFRDLSYLVKYADERPTRDLQVVVALTSNELESTKTFLAENLLEATTLIVPENLTSPFLQKLGILSEDEISNLIVLKPDGRIAAMASGLTMQTKARGNFLKNIIEWDDERTILAALEKEDLATAKDLAFSFAPPLEPDDSSEQKSNAKKPIYSLPHLRARTRVYLALGDLKAALAGAEEIVRRQTEIDASMSFRTRELDAAEELRDLVRSTIHKNE